MEEVVVLYLVVVECCVVGVQDDMWGQVLIGLVLIKDGVIIDYDELEDELVEMVWEKIGVIVCFCWVMVVECLFKICFGKILRWVICQIVDGEEYIVFSIIDDLVILEEISQCF